MFRDVRMRGFRRRADVERVQAWVDEQTVALDVERVGLAGCAGRILAEDVISAYAVPAFPRAAMDGWAVRGGPEGRTSAHHAAARCRRHCHRAGLLRARLRRVHHCCC